MSLYNKSHTTPEPLKRAILIGALGLGVCALSACGYSPLYGTTSTSPGLASTLQSVEIKPINDRVGQMTRTALKQRFSPTAHSTHKLYALDVKLSENISTLAVEKDASATRGNLKLSASYVLSRKADGLQLNSGSVTGVSSYNIISSDFATESAKNNARKRAIEFVADRIRTQVSTYFQAHKNTQPPVRTRQSIY